MLAPELIMFFGIAINSFVRTAVDCEVCLPVSDDVMPNDGYSPVYRRFENTRKNGPVAHPDVPWGADVHGDN